MLNSIQRKAVASVRPLQKFISVKVEIRLFGKLVWSFVWPPESVADDAINSLSNLENDD